jgi:hypothetical protein
MLFKRKVAILSIESKVQGMKFASIVKGLLSFLILTAIFIAIAIKYSIAETSFQCNGEISGESSTIFIKLGEYRWWVHLWSNSDGDLKLEIPNRYYDYYSPLTEIGDQLQIWDREKQRGNFSKLSNALTLDTATGVFKGTCTRMHDR